MPLQTKRVPFEFCSHGETINKLVREQRNLLQEWDDPTPNKSLNMDMTPEKGREILKIAQEPVSGNSNRGRRR